MLQDYTKNIKLRVLENDNHEDIHLKYYIFDWDDNILHMGTTINMQKFDKENSEWNDIEVSTSNFAKVRHDTENYRLPLKKDGTPDYDLAFENFRDTGKKGEDIFIHDIIEAIDNDNFGVSFNAFKTCLINGNLFAIVTARGHEPDTIKRGIMYFIETQLTSTEKLYMRSNLKYYCDVFGLDIPHNKRLEHYLSICEYIGVSSDYFINSVSKEDIPNGEVFSANNPELSKKIAVERFCKKCIDFSDRINKKIKTIEVGFSDDDIHNVKSITELFVNRLKKMYSNVEFSIYDTSRNKDNSINYERNII